VGVYFSAADVVVAPYRRATGSGAVQLASGFGVPVIVSEVCTGDSEPLKERGRFVVPPESPQALAEAIVNFYHHDHMNAAGTPAMADEGHVPWQTLVSCIEEGETGAGLVKGAKRL
jgi:glycosyltransferase involved in cell wall biosynthesis